MLNMYRFVCHMNVFPVIAELKEPTRKRTNFVSGASMLTCLLVYVVGGVFGFLAFGSHVESDVIQVRHNVFSSLVLSVYRYKTGAFDCSRMKTCGRVNWAILTTSLSQLEFQ